MSPALPPHLQSQHSRLPAPAPTSTAALLTFPFFFFLLLCWLKASPHSPQILPKPKDKRDAGPGCSYLGSSLLPGLQSCFPEKRRSLSIDPAMEPAWSLRVSSSPKIRTARSPAKPPPLQSTCRWLQQPGRAWNKRSGPFPKLLFPKTLHL